MNAPSVMSAVTVLPTGPVVGSIRPPGSKSLSNRALLCAALANGPSRLTGLLQSEDTEVMLAGLRQLGAIIDLEQGGRQATISRGIEPWTTHPPADLWVANSGTTIRFLAAALSALGGNYRLDGVPRMRQRPLGDLLSALEQLGSQAICEATAGCPPVVLQGAGWHGGEVSVAGSVSSQFLSGLLMAAPLARGALTIHVAGELVSQPYVEMTVRTMQRFGVCVGMAGDQLDRFEIPAPQSYQGINWDIEPDASAASYPWAVAAITGGRVTVEGLSRDSLQGDVRFCEVLEQMGCQVEWNPDSITVVGSAPLRGITVNMGHISDTVQTLAIVALFAEGPTEIRGVGHNRFKETDRIADLATELRKLGATVDEFSDGLRISPPRQITPTRIETYHDHRMAMSFALAGLRAAGVTILNPACTAKTYPEFFADLETLTGQAHHWESS